MALINNDRSAKEEYLNKAKIIKSQKEEINNIKNEITSMKNDVTDIKELLKQLISKGTNG
jgi:DNA anti-recombination protein RmuC